MQDTVKEQKDTLMEQKKIVSDVRSDIRRETHKRNSEISKKSKTKLENDISSVIQTEIPSSSTVNVIQTEKPSSSTVNNVMTIDEGFVDQIIEKLANKLSVPLITKDKTVRTINEVTEET